MSIVTTAPTINYVSSSDITKSTSPNDNRGYLRYQIFFDESVATNGNIIMFEYMIHSPSNNEYLPSNTVYGFVSVDAAIQAGIVNQYTLAIPAIYQTYGNLTNLDTIQFRVYTGDKSTQEVIATEWSLPLNVYNPPVEPNLTILAYSYYNTPSANLYVFFDETDNPYYFENMNFIVCFYYKDSGGDTIWRVSDPLPALPVSGSSVNLMVITVPNIEPVLTDASVYLNIHAVYDWQDANNNYYSVSSASADLIAIEASTDSAPDITNVDYNVYNSPSTQTINVIWSKPGNATVPFFEVDYYSLYYSIGGDPFSKYGENLSSNILNLTVDVNGLMNCGESIVFRVDVTTINNQTTSSAISQPTYYFEYAGPVSGLNVYDTYVNSTNPNSINLTVNFNQVSSVGCGDPIRYVINIYGTDYFEPYVPSVASYDISYTDLSIDQVGNVSVYLQTQDTNSENYMNGESVTAPYIANNLVLEPVDYNVYATGAQTIDLAWNNIVSNMTGWTLVNYLVEVKIGEGSWESIVGGEGQTPYTNTVYTYNVSLSAVSELLAFRVTATVSNESTLYDIVSNNETKNTFSYAGPANNAIINWAIANTDNTTMDIYMQFQNPLSSGVNNGISNFLITLYNDTGVIINSQNPINKPYSDAVGHTYEIYFNNVPYYGSGSIVIETFVEDTNSNTNITSSSSTQSESFITSEAPIFIDLSYNAFNNTFNGTIVSYDVLHFSGQLIYKDKNSSSSALTKATVFTNNTTPGFNISVPVVNDDGTLSYVFELQFASGPNFDSPFPGLTAHNDWSLSVCNNYGVGTLLDLARA